MSGGFYYDEQTRDKSLTVTLHPNQKLVYNDFGEVWKDFKPEEVDNEYYGTIGSGEKEREITWKYSLDPICSCIIQEDFQVSIVNNFTPFGNDAIGTAFNELKPLAPYMGEIGDALGVIADKTKDYDEKRKKDDYLSKGFQIFAEIAEKMKQGTKGVSDFLSRSLVGQGTMFSYYSGTGVDFGNLQLKFTLFSQFLKVKRMINRGGVLKELPSTYEFVTVDQQLKKILPYVVGQFKDFSIGEINDKLGTNIDTTSSFAENAPEFFKWQMPPGGFESDFHSIDVVQKGTLKLRIGPYIAVENLVIKTCQFNYSKVMIKNPKAQLENSADIVVPHSCEVVLGIAPISKYSRSSLEKFIFGRASENYRSYIRNDILTNSIPEKDYEMYANASNTNITIDLKTDATSLIDNSGIPFNPNTPIWVYPKDPIYNDYTTTPPVIGGEFDLQA